MLAFAPSRLAGVREIESLDLCLFLNVPLPIRRPGWWCLAGGVDGADVGVRVRWCVPPSRPEIGQVSSSLRKVYSDVFWDGVPAASASGTDCVFFS